VVVVVVVGLFCVIGVDIVVCPGELFLLSEFAFDAELALDIPRHNAKHFTSFLLLDDPMTLMLYLLLLLKLKVRPPVGQRP
jgi:hypothetical protein